MFRYFKLYLEFAKQNIKVMLEYRVDFIIGALSTFISQSTGILFLWIIFANIKSINGWSFYEVTFVYGLLTIAKAINHIFFDNLWILGNSYIKSGKFDILMLRPISPLFHLIADNLQKDGFGNLIIGIIITIKSIYVLNLDLGISGLMLLLLFVTCGGLIFAAINTITSTSSFKIVDSIEFMWSIAANHQFAQYPITLYPKIIREGLTWVLPFAFASFYPATYFLHKGYEQFALLTPIVTIILWIIALRVWNFGIKHYTSTGS